MNRLILLGLWMVAACGRPSSEVQWASERLAQVVELLDEERLGAVESSLEELAKVDDFRIERQVRFLRGNLFFAQAHQRATRAQAALGTPADWKEAMRCARAAQRAWKSARGDSLDWPAARRNVERAELWIADLLAAAEASGVELDPGDFTQRNPAEDLPSPPEDAAQESPPMPPPPTPERVDSLLERMQQQEERKRSGRRAQPGLDAPEVKRDW